MKSCDLTNEELSNVLIKRLNRIADDYQIEERDEFINRMLTTMVSHATSLNVFGVDSVDFDSAVRSVMALSQSYRKGCSDTMERLASQKRAQAICMDVFQNTNETCPHCKTKCVRCGYMTMRHPMSVKYNYCANCGSELHYEELGSSLEF